MFLSYSHTEAAWVENELRPELESPSSPSLPSYTCCVHTRDFLPGLAIPEQIITNMEASSGTIMVISSSYCRQHWTRLEWREALRQSEQDRTKVTSLTSSSSSLSSFTAVDHSASWRHIKRRYWRQRIMELYRKQKLYRYKWQQLLGQIEVKHNNVSFSEFIGILELCCLHLKLKNHVYWSVKEVQMSYSNSGHSHYQSLYQWPNKIRFYLNIYVDFSY